MSETKTKKPTDYTEDEMDLMQIDKKRSKEYHQIMSMRRKAFRKEKEAKKKEDEFPAGEIIDRMSRENPQGYKKLVKAMGKAVIAELDLKLQSTTEYPQDTIRDWRMTIRAIERGMWFPTTPQRGTWKPPRAKSAFEKFMNS